MIAAFALTLAAPTEFTVRDLSTYCTIADRNPVCSKFILAAWTGTQIADYKTAELRHVPQAICAPQDEPSSVLVPRVTAWLAADLARYPADADEPAAPFVSAMMYVFYPCAGSPLKK